MRNFLPEMERYNCYAHISATPGTLCWLEEEYTRNDSIYTEELATSDSWHVVWEMRGRIASDLYFSICGEE